MSEALTVISKPINELVIGSPYQAVYIGASNCQNLNYLFGIVQFRIW